MMDKRSRWEQRKRLSLPWREFAERFDRSRRVHSVCVHAPFTHGGKRQQRRSGVLLDEGRQNWRQSYKDV